MRRITGAGQGWRWALAVMGASTILAGAIALAWTAPGWLRPQAAGGALERALIVWSCLALIGFAAALWWIRRQSLSLRRLDARIEDMIDRMWELREAAERNRSLIESQGDLIVRRDSEGKVTYANEAFCRLLGCSENEIVGNIVSPQVLEQGEATLAPDGTRVHDQQIATALGARWIAWREVTVRDDASSGPEIQSVGRDVTERAAAEQTLLEARNQAESANRAKSRFLAMISHEIRTPLNGILGMADLLEGTVLSPEQQTYAKAIATSGGALLSLIEELLDFSKIEAGKIEVDVQPFDLGRMVEELIELLAPRAQAKGIELACFVDDRLASERLGDAMRLRQVLLNLVGNAIKFTPEGGVALVVEPGTTPDVVRFSVEDTGIGISPEAQSRIFLEFEQAEAGANRRFSGTGLGLSISQRIVERMGGSIVLRSERGRGSEFRFELTLPPAESTQPGRMSPDLNGLAALIVSATRIEAPMIARQLGHWGAKTCIVADDAAAKALIPERAWDLLIVDRQLGRGVAQDLARTAAHAVATRLVLIAPGDRHELPDFKEFGFSGYLIKPVRGQSLAARLAQTEDRTGPEDALAADAFDDLVPCPEPTRGLAVLVAEDNEINALLARSLLTKLGHHPTIAGNGALAVESWLAARACGAPYDLVLMDLHMPEVDGLEAARRIRAVEADSGDVRTPILALTANAFAEDRDACLKSGMDGFLTKPLDRERLAQALALAKSPPLTPMAA